MNPALLDCIHCGLCLPACPTYRETGNEALSPRGRLFLLRAIEENRLELDAASARPIDLCLGCRACEPACPSGVDYGGLLESARARIREEARGPLRRLLEERITGGILTRPNLLRLALLPLMVLRALGLGSLARVLSRAGRSRRGPLRLAASLPTPAMRLGVPRELRPDDSSARRTVSLFTGCVARVLDAPALRATARILQVAGFRVVTPRGQGCCGALHLHAGDRDGARRRARRLVEAFAGEGSGEIVVAAAGCGAAMKEYERLLPENEAARRFAARVRDILEFLDASGWEPGPRPVEGTVAIHDPCHLAHVQGIHDAPRRLLGKVRGLRLVDLEESDVCCGSAGSYSLQEPSMADRLLRRKVDRIRRSGASVIAAANPGCAMQIRLGLAESPNAPRVEHPVRILARTLARPGGALEDPDA